MALWGVRETGRKSKTRNLDGSGDTIEVLLDCGGHREKSVCTVRFEGPALPRRCTLYYY